MKNNTNRYASNCWSMRMARKRKERGDNQRTTPTKFRTSYSDIISGVWSKNWAAHQLLSLPKHRISHTEDKLVCTCGIGPFDSMSSWSIHATSLTFEDSPVRPTHSFGGVLRRTAAAREQDSNTRESRSGTKGR